MCQLGGPNTAHPGRGLPSPHSTIGRAIRDDFRTGLSSYSCNQSQPARTAPPSDEPRQRENKIALSSQKRVLHSKIVVGRRGTKGVPATVAQRAWDRGHHLSSTVTVAQAAQSRVSPTGRSPDGTVSNYWLLQCGTVQILVFNDILTMADGWADCRRRGCGSHNLEYCGASFVDSALQDEIHHVVIFSFVFNLQTLGEVNQMNLDLLDYRIPLQDTARDFIRHCG